MHFIDTLLESILRMQDYYKVSTIVYMIPTSLSLSLLPLVSSAEVTCSFLLKNTTALKLKKNSIRVCQIVNACIKSIMNNKLVISYLRE